MWGVFLRYPDAETRTQPEQLNSNIILASDMTCRFMFLISFFCNCNWVRILVSLEEMALTNKDLDSEDEEMFLMLQRLNEMEKRLERFKMMEDALESKAHLVDGLTDRLVGLEHRTANLETQLKEKQDEIVQLYDRIAKFQTALDVKEAEVKQLRQQLDDSLADRDARLIHVTEQLGVLEQTNADLVLRIEDLRREDEGKKLQMRTLEQNVVSVGLLALSFLAWMILDPYVAWS